MTDTHELPPTKEDDLYLCPFCERNGIENAAVVIENTYNPKVVCRDCGEMKWSDIVRGAKENFNKKLLIQSK